MNKWTNKPLDLRSPELDYVNIDDHYARILTSNRVAGVLVDLGNDRMLVVRKTFETLKQPDNQSGLATTCADGPYYPDLTPQNLLTIEASRLGVSLAWNNIVFLNNGVPVALMPVMVTRRTYLVYAEIMMEPVNTPTTLDPQSQETGSFWVALQNLETFTCDDACLFGFVNYILRRRLERRMAEVEARYASLQQQIERQASTHAACVARLEAELACHREHATTP